MLHTFYGHYYTKQVKYMKKCDCNNVFLCISHFSCSRVHQKYATWILLGRGIKIFIQILLLLEMSVKKLGDKLKIRVKNLVLLFYLFLIFLPFYLKNGESSHMVEIIILNPIGPFLKFIFFVNFLRRPILDLKIPLMRIKSLKQYNTSLQ